MTKRTRKTLLYICAAFTFMFFWVTLMEYLKIHLFFKEKEDNPLFKFFGGYLERTPFSQFFFPIVLAPLWEEAVFRYGPLMLAKRINKRAVWPVVIITSLWFGWMHAGQNVLYVLEQGVMGFALAFVLIKSKYRYWSSVLLHALYNFAVIFAVQILSK